MQRQGQVLGAAAVYVPGKPLRGGIPVCWPQFSDMGSLPPATWCNPIPRKTSVNCFAICAIFLQLAPSRNEPPINTHVFEYQIHFQKCTRTDSWVEKERWINVLRFFLWIWMHRHRRFLRLWGAPQICIVQSNLRAKIRCQWLAPTLLPFFLARFAHRCAFTTRAPSHERPLHYPQDRSQWWWCVFVVLFAFLKTKYGSGGVIQISLEYVVIIRRASVINTIQYEAANLLYSQL